MNRPFKDVLRVYRRASSSVEVAEPGTPEPDVHPIRLIVSRSASGNDERVTNGRKTSLPRPVTVQRESVMQEAAKIASTFKDTEVRCFVM